MDMYHIYSKEQNNDAPNSKAIKVKNTCPFCQPRLPSRTAHYRQLQANGTEGNEYHLKKKIGIHSNSKKGQVRSLKASI